jgi:hypothetical protein
MCQSRQAADLQPLTGLERPTSSPELKQCRAALDSGRAGGVQNAQACTALLWQIECIVSCRFAGVSSAHGTQCHVFVFILGSHASLL